MQAENVFQVDIGQLDDYIVSLRQRLEAPINDRLVEFSARRDQLVRLLDVANMLQQEDAIGDVTEKLQAVEHCIGMLQTIWDSQQNGPAPPMPPAIASDDAPDAVPEEPNEAQASAKQPPAEGKSDTDRIAEEALRESRRRSMAGANSMKASASGIPNKSYDVTPANGTGSDGLGNLGLAGRLR